MRNAPNNRIAKMALSMVLLSCLFGQSVTLPAMAQYSLQAETDSFLPPEVVPLDPAVAQKMSQAQAQARQESANNSNSYGQNSAMSGSPTGSNDAGMNNFNNQNSMMNQNGMNQNGMNLGNMSQGQPNFQSNMGGQEVPGNTGTSDWIMPGQDQNSPMTAYGNVSQTQTLTAPPANPPARRSTRYPGMGTAVGALATFGAGAMVGSMIRRPSSLYGLGAAGLMMTGFGARNAFRF
jgi:hypothetical protein